MKVALICNMNNNFFSLVRYLRDYGINAELLIMKYEFEHFSPKADSYTSDYLEYTKQLTWGKHNFLGVSSNVVENDIKGYDFIIGCGTTPAYMNKINRQLDLFVPYGSDFYEMPFFRLTNLENYYHIFQTYKRSKNQLKGIQNSRNIFLAGVTPEFEQISDILNVRDKIRTIFLPMVYSPTYNPDIIKNFYHLSTKYHEFKMIRDEFDIVIFHHSRHQWKNIPNKWSYKGNEKLIKGFADFVNSNSSLRSCLILFEYGPDVKASKKLVTQLGITKYVRWFPKMLRKDIMIGISMADIGAVNFGTSWFSGGVLFEFLAMGIPTMQYRVDNNSYNLFSELYPTINVSSSQEITKALFNYVNNPSKFKEIGKKGRAWYQKYVVENSVDEYIKIISQSNNR